MKVLISAIGHYREQPSGSAKVAFEEGVALAERGEEVWLLAPGNDRLPSYEVCEGVHLLRYKPTGFAPWNPARTNSHQRPAQALLRKYLPQVDMVHGHVPLVNLAATSFYGNSVQRSYTVHSPARMEMAIVWGASSGMRKMTAPLGLPLINRMERTCLREANVITALSQYTIGLMAHLHGKELASRIKLVPGWVDTERFVPVANRSSIKRKLGWPADIPLLFTLRRLVPRMGIDRLLHAVALLRAEGRRLHLVVGGSGRMEADLKAQASRLGILDWVTFMGRVPDETLPLAYAASDAFVLPTAELECFGLIALEALSSGRPVLATAVGAIPEILTPLEPKWLARSAEPGEIANLLGSYLRGDLPEHDAWQLHDFVSKRYRRSAAQASLILATH